MRAFLIILDSVGIGEAPDAADYHDTGSATLPHTAAHVGGIALPEFENLGLGCIPDLLPKGIPIQGVACNKSPQGAFGAMQEVSKGKDTTTGHWEIAGLEVKDPLHLFPPGPPAFPETLIADFERETGRKTIGNRAASGTRIIQELGETHEREGAWIVYTSADSVFQIAAHEAVIPLHELYRACTIARRLCDPYHVGRVIARPFTGKTGAYTRTENRRDFSMPPPEPTLLDILHDAGTHCVTVGKLDDVFANHGIDESHHAENNADAQTSLLELAGRLESGFVFANLIDFDMLYGHRRDAGGYAAALEQTDAFLETFIRRLRPDDLMIITADHGNDPTFTGADHTREFVPLIVWGRRMAGRNLGIRHGFYDVSATLADFFGMPPLKRGISFLRE